MAHLMQMFTFVDLFQGRRNRGGSGGSCPPNFETGGALPPQLSSVNLLSFHHSYKFYKDVLRRSQPAAAKHIVSLS